MLALVSSELADRDRRAVISLDRGPQRPQASQAAKCLQPITLRSQDRAEPAGDAFESLRQRQLIHERSRQTQAELAYAAGRLEMCSMSIAHEVNQPLSAIVTNGETCLRRLDRDEPDLDLIRELVRRVIADARRASEIVVSVSDMAKGTAPRHLPLPFNAVIEEAVASLRHEFQSKDIAVSLDLAAGLPPVEGDRIQLQQVVVNLLVNAAQAISTGEKFANSTAGGGILIRTSLSSLGAVHCSIEDAGPGIAVAHLPHLFGHFFTTKRGGKGIGLQISKSIVEAHGGWIGADNKSALGGARFSFTLPGNVGD
jgi:signal transduction histidine kinase